jgi:hypothetical protein
MSNANNEFRTFLTENAELYDYEDPIFYNEDDRMWYYYPVTWQYPVGPYIDREDAEDACMYAFYNG